MTPFCMILALGTLATATGSGMAVVSAGTSDVDSSVTWADELRQTCTGRIPGMLSKEETTKRLLGFSPVSETISVADANAGLEAAVQQYHQGQYAKAAEMLAALIARLEKDGAFSKEKAEVLVRCRLKAADALLAAGGMKETGRGESPQGRLAREQLVKVLHVYPLYQLEPADYPPRMRLVMDYARKQVAGMGSGFLDVKSAGSEPTLVVEGRAIGPVPARVGLPNGWYRLWLEEDGRRTPQRTVEVKDGVTKVDIDFELEVVMDPLKPHLGLGDEVQDPAWLARFSQRMGGVVLAVVYPRSVNGQKGAAVVLKDAQSKTLLRHGAAVGEGAGAKLCQFVAMGGGSLELESNPSKATVWLDDVLLVREGSVQRWDSLVAGPHTLRVVHEDQPVELAVMIVDGQVTRVRSGVEAGKPWLKPSSGTTAPVKTGTVSESTSSAGGRPLVAWLAPVVAGVVGGGVGLGVAVLGTALTGGGGFALALAPRNESGQFRPMAQETAEQGMMRVRMSILSLVVGGLVMGMAAVGGVVSVVLVIAGVVLKLV